jgi:hypothetical protein
MVPIMESQMQNLVNPVTIASRPEVFTSFQIKKVQNLAKKATLVSIPERDFQRTQKAPLSVLFYDESQKLRLMRIGQHNVLTNKVSR